MSVRPDGIHQRGRAAVLAGQELLDVPPGPGSTRWGLSLDVRLDPATEQHLDALAAEASTHAGPGQWLTGAHGSSHLTVTYLERAWREVSADDEDVRRYAALVDWVDARLSLPPVLATAERVEVVRYAYDGVRTTPVALSAAALPGVPEGAAGGTHP